MQIHTEKKRNENTKNTNTKSIYICMEIQMKKQINGNAEHVNENTNTDENTHASTKETENVSTKSEYSDIKMHT